MEIKIENMSDYVDYIKCGEILKSPLHNSQISFVLECSECGQIHLSMETFINDIVEHLKTNLALEDKTSGAISEDAVEESKQIDNLSMKLEVDDALEMEDPLVLIKHADDGESYEANNDETLEAHDYAVESNSEQLEILEDSESNTDDEFQLEDAESDDVEFGNKTTKKRGSTSAVVNAFIESKTNIRTLIKFYKNQPNLYTKNYPLYRFQDEKQASLEEITRDVNRELNLKLTWKEISQLINYLRRKHREEYRRLQHHKDKDNNKNYKYSWFFEDLSFLNPESVIKLNKIDSHLPELTNEQIVKLILIYEEHPHLWNSNLIEYVCSNKRHDSHMKMLKSLENNMNLRISKNTLEKYLRNIHSYFSQEKCFRTNFANNEAALKTRCDDFYKHLLYLFDHEGPFQCTECNKVFLKPFGFKVHMSGHTDLAPFVCSRCNKEFKKVTSYTNHVKNHFEDYDVACPQCDKKFVSKTNLYIHSAVHSGERPYCCEICGASFRYRSCFRSHLIYHEKRYSHTCHICSKGYYSKERYNDHMNSHMNIRSHICKVCDKGFITRRALKEHIAIHVNVRNYACEVCGKKFKVKSGLSQHMKIHRSKIDIKDKIECFVQKST